MLGNMREVFRRFIVQSPPRPKIQMIHLNRKAALILDNLFP